MTASPSAGSWALRLEALDCRAAAALRLMDAIQVCQTDDGFWLRGSRRDAHLDRHLAMMPGGQRFRVDNHGLGTPDGCLLPTIRIPDAGWEPIAAFFPIRFATAALPGAVPERFPLGVQRCEDEHPCTALLCAWEAWARWADDAPLIRLSPLRFSRSGARALVLGDPLPPMPGIRCHVQGAVILPAGLELTPIADPALAAEVLRLDSGDIAIVDAAGEWERVPAAAIVSAHRASVRATNTSVADG